MQRHGPEHDQVVPNRVRFEMSFEKQRIANDVVIQDENQVTMRRLEAQVTGSGQSAIWLAEKLKTAPRPEVLQHLQSAVGGSINSNDNFKPVRWKFLAEEGSQRAR